MNGLGDRGKQKNAVLPTWSDRVENLWQQQRSFPPMRRSEGAQLKTLKQAQSTQNMSSPIGLVHRGWGGADEFGFTICSLFSRMCDVSFASRLGVRGNLTLGGRWWVEKSRVKGAQKSRELLHCFKSLNRNTRGKCSGKTKNITIS